MSASPSDSFGTTVNPLLMIVQQPLPELITAAEGLDAIIAEIINAKNSVASDFGEFEAPIEAWVLLNLAIRTAESVVVLARTDAVLAPAAHQLLRSLFEIAVRIRWILYPENAYEREARWLAHLAEEEAMWERLAKIARETGASVGDYSSRAQLVYAFRSSVAEELRKHTTVTAKVPKFRQALKEQGMERRYIAYSLHSQFVHGGHLAGESYRRGLGTKKELRETSFHKQWPHCLKMACWALTTAVTRFIEVACQPGTLPFSQETLNSFNASLVAAEAAASRVAV